MCAVNRQKVKGQKSIFSVRMKIYKRKVANRIVATVFRVEAKYNKDEF